MPHLFQKQAVCSVQSFSLVHARGCPLQQFSIAGIEKGNMHCTWAPKKEACHMSLRLSISQKLSDTRKIKLIWVYIRQATQVPVEAYCCANHIQGHWYCSTASPPVRGPGPISSKAGPGHLPSRRISCTALLLTLVAPPAAAVGFSFFHCILLLSRPPVGPLACSTTSFPPILLAAAALTQGGPWYFTKAPPNRAVKILKKFWKNKELFKCVFLSEEQSAFGSLFS